LPAFKANFKNPNQTIQVVQVNGCASDPSTQIFVCFFEKGPPEVLKHTVEEKF